ncbi:hypothetical protein CVT25_014451 [Psilocybe cyanescens]|uniref:Uncharacterized protein n=1 Tax=Psilocybe cyanescens TaxID=93625 RepID=A0A409XR83_PSICY|nr:hypothetical protein CVT25_014451 [Psilocybe cyanescens]
MATNDDNPRNAHHIHIELGLIQSFTAKLSASFNFIELEGNMLITEPGDDAVVLDQVFHWAEGGAS